MLRTDSHSLWHRSPKVTTVRRSGHGIARCVEAVSDIPFRDRYCIRGTPILSENDDSRRVRPGTKS